MSIHKIPDSAAERFASGLRLALVGAMLTLAAVASPAWSQLLGESEEPIHIRADTAELDEREGTVIYRGNVRMTQGDVELLADLVTVLLEDEQVVRITAEGDRARYRQLVGEDRELVTALARTIIYATQDEIVELIGNAHLAQRHNEFAGGMIRYDMRAGRVVAEGEDDEGVQMILQPPARRN